MCPQSITHKNSHGRFSFTPYSPDILSGARLVMVTGKGGAGKTTLASVLAFCLAKNGLRVLLADAGDTDGLSPLFGSTVGSRLPAKIGHNIWALLIDPMAELKEFTTSKIKGRFLADRITNSRLFTQLFQAVPGIEAVMGMGRIWRLANGLAPRAPKFDVVVVDAPATGHGLGLLRSPRTLADMIQAGPLARDLKQMNQMLVDETASRLVVAVLPEDPGVNEALEFSRAVEKDPGMKVAAFFALQMIPEFFTPTEKIQIQSLVEKRKKDHGGLDTLASASVRMIQGRKGQIKSLERLFSQAPAPIVELPFLFCHHVSREQIITLARDLGTTGQ